MIADSKFYIESQTSKAPDHWSRHSQPVFSNQADAKKFVLECLERLETNGEANFKTFGFKVLSYRIVELNTTVKDTILETFPVIKQPLKMSYLEKEKYYQTKQEELHYISQILKYLKHLEYLYKNSSIKDSQKLDRIKKSINNTNDERGKILREIDSTDLETWRLFDQS
jgi:hypothetical protein